MAQQKEYYENNAGKLSLLAQNLSQCYETLIQKGEEVNRTLEEQAVTYTTVYNDNQTIDQRVFNIKREKYNEQFQERENKNEQPNNQYLKLKDQN